MSSPSSFTKLSPIHFLETVLQIIEERQIHYPKFVYCFMIVILYSQYIGYIFSEYETKPLLDPKLQFFATWNEISPPDFMLFLNGIDRVTIVVIIMMHMVLLFYVFYIISLTIVRIYYPELLRHVQSFMKYINSFYQIFFSSFLWVLYIPFTEVHAGIMVIGGNSFLAADRDYVSYSQKPIILIVMGAIGVSLTLCTGMILSYCYISYDFHEQNLLKRSFKPNLVLQLLCRTLLVTLYYININNITIVKYGFGHILGLTALYDFFRYIPFRDEFICLFYGSTTIIYEYLVILFSFWELTDILLEYNLFFCWVIPSPLLIGFIFIFYKWKYFQILKLHPKDIDRDLVNHIDFFLDIFYETAQMSDKNKIDKLKILGLLDKLFKTPMKDIRLFERAKFKSVIMENNEIDMENLVGIMSEMFQIFLSDQNVKEHQDVYENVLMKYCTFLSNYHNNPIKGYYELKKQLIMGKNAENEGNNEHESTSRKRTQPSVIFKIISNLISDQIEGLIAEIFMYKYHLILDTNSKKKYADSSKIEENNEGKLNFAFLPRTTEICYFTIEDYKKFVKTKILFFEKLIKGFQSLDEVKRDSINVVTSARKIKKTLEMRAKQTINNNFTENAIILKLESLFYRLIQNDRLTFCDIESKLLEIRKKDFSIANLATRSSYLDSKTIILTISLLREGGILTNKITHKIAEFFGYQLIEFPVNRSIHKLMPNAIADIHPNMINRFIKKGPGKIFNTERSVYVINKMNYAFPVSLQLTLSFYCENDYCVSGILTKIERSSMDIIFSEDGKIIAMTENFTNPMPKLRRIDVKDLYSKFNLFVFMPDLLEKLPTEIDVQNWIKKKEFVIDVFPTKILPFYFINNIAKVLQFYKTYSHRHADINKVKKFYKRFVNCSICKPFITKKFISFYLKLELFPLKDHSVVKLFTLQIKNIFKETEINDDYNELNSYTGGGLSSNTVQTLITETATVNSERSEQNFPNNLLQDALKNKFLGDIKLEDNIDIQDPDEKKKIEKIILNEENLEEEKKSSETDDPTDKKAASDKGKNKGRSNQSSYTAMRTNYGECLLSEIVNKTKTNPILKKLMFLSLFQISFFLMINILYHFLVNDKIVVLSNDMQDVKNELIFINSFYKTAFISNLCFLQQNNIIGPQDFDINMETMQNTIITTYDKLKNIEENIILQVPQGEIQLETFVNSKAQFSLSMMPALVTTLIYQIVEDFENSLENKGGFFRTNFLNISLANSNIINQKFNDFQNIKDNLVSFYLSLSFIAIFCGLFLQIWTLPFLHRYSKYIEKILFLTTRLQEKECLLEIFKLKTALSKLESVNEAYLTYDFERLEEIKLGDEMEHENKKGTSKKSYNVSYLSSKISQNKLSMKGSYFFMGIPLLIISGYYSGVFVYLNKLKSGLDDSFNIIQYTNTYYDTLSKLDSLKMMILMHKEVNESAYISDQDINSLNNEFNDAMDSLNEVIDNNLNFQLMSDIGSLFDNYNNLLISDLCTNQQIPNICGDYFLENMKFGIQGYASYLHSKLSQMSFLFIQLNSSNSNVSFNEINQYLILEGNLNDTLMNFGVLQIALDNLLNETNSIVNYILGNLTDQMLWLLLIGGVFCSIFWLGVNMMRYEQMKKDLILCREILRLIPLSKLAEEATTHLLKALENI